MSAAAPDLRRLMRQAGVRPAASTPACVSPEPEPVGSEGDIPATERLAALRLLLQRRERAVERQPEAGVASGSIAPEPPLPGTEIAPGLRLCVAYGHWPRLDDALDVGFAGPRWTGPARVSRRQLLCFDTETTGLAGGTGTRAFMIGAADWMDDGRLRLRQLMITRLGAERAMLEAFREWLDPGTVLVSYNGRSYDAPLLNTRYRLARMASPLQGLSHLDLLHPVRRRWRGLWPNCRLATVERELLGVAREDDLPGSQAPAAWLHYLRCGRGVGRVNRVLAHNAQDLRSLGGLLGRLATDVHTRGPACL